MDYSQESKMFLKLICTANKKDTKRNLTRRPYLPHPTSRVSVVENKTATLEGTTALLVRENETLKEEMRTMEEKGCSQYSRSST